jgi:hypothetical protein
VADIHFTYKNGNLIEALRERGTAIKNNDWPEYTRLNAQLDRVKEAHHTDLVTPVSAFVTFEQEEARIKREAMQWSFLLPQLPRLVHGALTRHQDADRLIDEVRALRREQQLTNRWYAAATVLLMIVVGLAGWAVLRA